LETPNFSEFKSFNKPYFLICRDFLSFNCWNQQKSTFCIWYWTEFLHMPIYRITSIDALSCSICNTLKEGMYLIEGKNLSLHNNIVTISGQRFVVCVYVLFSFNYKVYLICILAIIKKRMCDDYVIVFFFTTLCIFLDLN